MADDITADVIIVGSGVSGAILASKLAADGVKVAILEAGAAVDRQDALQIYWDALIKVPECPYPPVPEAMHPISNDLKFWYEQDGPDEFASTYLKVVGGTTWHWLGTCLRLVPNDFKLKTLYGQGVDWPISYDDIEPFYGMAEDEIGVAGDSADDLGAPRTTPYPMPEIPLTYLDKSFFKALDGTPYEVRSTPQGRNSQDRDNRPGLLRQRELHPDLSDPGEIRRDRSSRPGDRGRRRTARKDDRGVRRGGRRSQGQRYSFQALGRQRGQGDRQGVRPRRPCHRDAAAAPQFPERGDAERRRQQLRPGRPQPDGSPDPAVLGARQGAGLAVSRAAIDLGDREPARRCVPQGARRVPDRDRQ